MPAYSLTCLIRCSKPTVLLQVRTVNLSGLACHGCKLPVGDKQLSMCTQ